MNIKLTINHIGYCVHSIENSVPFFISLGYSVKTEIFFHQLQKVYLQLLIHNTNNICIELLQPIDDNSPISTILKKNYPMPYHICYEFNDTEKAIYYCKKLQLRQITKMTFSPIFQKNSCFFFHKEIGICEILS